VRYTSPLDMREEHDRVLVQDMMRLLDGTCMKVIVEGSPVSGMPPGENGFCTPVEICGWLNLQAQAREAQGSASVAAAQPQ
jgi:hypothetical protein